MNPPTSSSRAPTRPYQAKQAGRNQVSLAWRRTPHLTQRCGAVLPTGDLPITYRCLGRWGPVALAGLDPVVAAARRPPRSAPGHRLGAVHRSCFAVMGDHSEASARLQGEGLGVVGGRSWHGSRYVSGALWARVPEVAETIAPQGRWLGRGGANLLPCHPRLAAIRPVGLPGTAPASCGPGRSRSRCRAGPPPHTGSSRGPGTPRVGR
jgi:hypothetical protein